MRGRAAGEVGGDDDPEAAMDPKTTRDGREGPAVQPEHLEGEEDWPDETGPADVAAAEDEETPSP